MSDTDLERLLHQRRNLGLELQEVNSKLTNAKRSGNQKLYRELKQHRLELGDRLAASRRELEAVKAAHPPKVQEKLKHALAKCPCKTHICRSALTAAWGHVSDVRQINRAATHQLGLLEMQARRVLRDKYAEICAHPDSCICSLCSLRAAVEAVQNVDAAGTVTDQLPTGKLVQVIQDGDEEVLRVLELATRAFEMLMDGAIPPADYAKFMSGYAKKR